MGAKLHHIFTNFRMGEITPRLFGRVDWERYQAGCVTLENFILHPQGGVTRRPGWRFVAEVKDSSKATRVIPFVRTSEDAYVLEMGDGYFRLFKNGAAVLSGLTPLEITSPFPTAVLFQTHATQVDDTLTLTQQGYAPQRLTKYSDTVWQLVPIVFDPPPSVEHGTRTSSTVGGPLTRGAGTTNVQFDGTQNIFLASDVGREILVTTTGLRVTITAVDSTTRIHGDIEDTSSNLGPYAAGDWKIDGSPMATVTPSAEGPIGATITLTLDANGWRAGDVGKYVILSGGVVEITAYTSDLAVDGKVLAALDGVTGQPGGAWSLEEAAWSAANGYPATSAVCENRLVFGGTTAARNGLWMSASYDFTNFALGSTDDSAISIRPSSGVNAEIRWFSPGRKFLMGTASDEFIISAPRDEALTPTNIRPLPSTPHGSCRIQTVRSEHATIFLTGNQRILRELAYAYEVDDYRAPNLLDVAEHLTRAYTIVDMAYQHPPESIIWAVRSDGTLLGCTYLRDQDMVGWHRHVTDGVVESVCTIPSVDGTTEQVWAVIKRTVGGATKRYIEYMDAAYPHWATAPGCQTDSAVTQLSPVATNVITGLSHLEGCTVKLLGDGAVFPDAVVSGGQATLQGGTAVRIEAGLGFTSTIQTVRPEIPNNGTGQGAPKAWGPIHARFVDTIGGKIQGETITSATPPVLFTGDKKVNTLGWDDDAWITVQQTQPLPMTLLSIFGTLAVGD